MQENVVVGKSFLLQRIKAQVVNPVWREAVLARKRRQSTGIDGGLARMAAPACAKLVEKWNVAYVELKVQKPLVLLKGGQSLHRLQLAHLRSEVCTVTNMASKHGAITCSFREGFKGTVRMFLPPPGSCSLETSQC